MHSIYQGSGSTLAWQRAFYLTTSKTDSLLDLDEGSVRSLIISLPNSLFMTEITVLRQSWVGSVQIPVRIMHIALAPWPLCACVISEALGVVGEPARHLINTWSSTLDSHQPQGPAGQARYDTQVLSVSLSDNNRKGSKAGCSEEAMFWNQFFS